MNSLSCSVDNCENNKSSYCCLTSIKVGGASAQSSAGTCCDSFTQKTNSFVNSTKDADPLTYIKCDVSDCSFNGQSVCNKDNVQINGMSACTCGETNCSSFQAK